MALVELNPYHKLSETGSILEFKDKQLPKLEMKDDKYKAKFVSFDTIQFENIVRFENVDLGIGLSFRNCSFNGQVVFFDNSAKGYDKELNFNNQSIVFKDCIFNSTIQFSAKENELERALAFENCNLLKGIQIEGIKVAVDGIKFANCKIEERLDVSDIKTKLDISFSSNTVNCKTRIENLKSDGLTFLGENIFNSDVFVRNSELRNGIVFNYGVFNKEVKIHSVFTGDTGLNIIGSAFEKAFYVNYQTNEFKPRTGIKSYYITECNFKSGLYVQGVKDILSDEPSIDEITIDFSAELKGDIYFSNFHLGIINLGGINSSCNLFLERIWVNQIKIKAFINNAGFILSGVRASYIEWKDKNSNQIRNNTLYIDDSNFGKAQFFQLDFSGFETIHFSNNIITEISTSLVKWFSPKQLNKNTLDISRDVYLKSLKSKQNITLNGGMLIDYKQKIINDRIALVRTIQAQREIFRQLKVVAQKQSDSPSTLEFQRHEMNYYRQEVKYAKPKNRVENFILWTSQTNNFGQNWFKAFLLLLLFSFAIYIPIGFINSDKLDYSKFISSSTEIWINLKVIFWDNLKTWLILFNPAHRVKDINENIDKYSSWIYFWDILSRIIVSYFIFQIISAFRKFNK